MPATATCSRALPRTLPPAPGSVSQTSRTPGSTSLDDVRRIGRVWDSATAELALGFVEWLTDDAGHGRQ